MSSDPDMSESSGQEENKMISEDDQTKLQEKKFKVYLRRESDLQKVEVKHDKTESFSEKNDILEDRTVLLDPSLEEKKPLISPYESFGKIVYVDGVPKEMISADKTVSSEDIKKDFELVKVKDNVTSCCEVKVEKKLQTKRYRISQEFIARSKVIKNTDKNDNSPKIVSKINDNKTVEEIKTDDKVTVNDEKLEESDNRKRKEMAEELNEFIDVSPELEDKCSPQKKKPKLVKTQDSEAAAHVLLPPKRKMSPKEVSGTNFKGINNRPVLLTLDQNLVGLPATDFFSSSSSVTIEPIPSLGTTIILSSSTATTLKNSFVPIMPSVRPSIVSPIVPSVTTVVPVLSTINKSSTEATTTNSFVSIAPSVRPSIVWPIAPSVTKVIPVFPRVGPSSIIEQRNGSKSTQVTKIKPTTAEINTSSKSQYVKKTQYVKCKHKTCTFQAISAAEMQAHIAEIHLTDVNDNMNFMGKYLPYVEISSQVQLVETFHCKLCSYSSPSKHNLKCHMLQHDDDAPRFQCSRCPFSTKYKGSLITHQRIHARDCQQTELQCQGCDHKLPHDVEKYICGTCPFETIYRASIIRHRQRHEQSLRELLLLE